MKVINYTTPKKETFKISYRKEKSFFKQFTVLSKDFEELIIVRLYGNNTIYACIWINNFPDPNNKDNKIDLKGSDKAGGGGYNKSIASVEHTLFGMGFEFDNKGCSTETTLSAIAKYMDYEDVKILVAHG